jgi:hypothetical protein
MALVPAISRRAPVPPCPEACPPAPGHQQRETQSFSVGVQIRESGFTSANTAEQLGAAILKMRGGEALRDVDGGRF